MIYFLDFDGVLHPFFPRAELSDAQNAHFAYVPAFEAAVRACPTADIVITSTWRNKYSLDQMRSHFSSDIAAMIISSTPKIGAGNGDGGRQVEVEAWLEQNGRAGEPWIGIDDFPQLYRPGATVVACHDEFAKREAEHLLEASLDPVGYAENYPVPAIWGQRKIILPGERP